MQPTRDGEAGLRLAEPKRGKVWKPSHYSIAFALPLVAALAAFALATCSSSQRRDQFYGTDAGAGYQPEAAGFTTPDTSTDEEATDALENASDGSAVEVEAEAGQDAEAEVGF
jgi:hypothetical protein